MPVHSESRQPRISSSSAISSNERISCSVTGLLELLLERVAVDAVVVPVQLVDEVVDLDDGRARNDPEPGRLATPPVLFTRVHVGEVVIRRLDRAGVLE